MPSIWRSLLWREWHEHKWKLAALMAIMLAVQSFVLLNYPHQFSPQIAIWLVCGLPGAFFIGLHASAGERSAGTLDFVRACPTNLRRFATAKLAMGAAVSILPIAAAMLLSIVWLLALQAIGASLDFRQPFVEAAGPLEDLLLSGIAAATVAMAVFFWTAAFGMNQPTERRAALACALGLVGWTIVCLVSLYLRRLNVVLGTNEATWDCILAISPVGVLQAASFHPPLWETIVGQLFSIAMAGAWCVTRFGRRDFIKSYGLKPTNASRTPLSAAYRRVWSAMAWKQWREAVPPSAAGLGIIAGMTMVYGVLGRIGANELYWSAKDELPSFLRGASLIVGTLVALVVGIGTFAGDMQPALLAFWRSRPIQPGLWFWPKYFIGASAVVIFLELPLVFVDLVMSGGRPELMIYDGILASAPLLHLLAYSAAVCAICWFRQAIYSGILALAFVLAIALAPIDRPSLDWLSVGMVINRLRTSTPATIDATLLYIYLPFALAMITLTGVVALLARQGIRVDGRFVHWPRWRRRRDSWA